MSLFTLSSCRTVEPGLDAGSFPLPADPQELFRKANNQGDVERNTHAVVVIPAVVLVERFAVVAIDDDQRIVFESEFRYAVIMR